MKGIFDGIRVFDFTTNIWGSFTSLLLAEAGAEVIKVEHSEGDPMRNNGYVKDGVSLTFHSLNLNKKSICVEFRQQEGADLVRKLICDSDLLIEDYMPGQMAKWNLSYNDCSELNPGLIYISVTGYGQHGPRSRCRPIDSNFIVESQMTATYPTVDIDEYPVIRGGDLSSYLGGLYGFCAATMAIYYRDNTGLGQHLDVNLLTATCTAAKQNMTLLTQANRRFDVNTEAKDRAGFAPMGVLRTKDGFIDFNASTDATYAALKKLMPYDEVLFDPKYEDPMIRAGALHLLLERIERWSVTLTSLELDHMLEKAKIPVGMITLHAGDLLSNEHLKATNRFMNVEVPDVGSLPFACFPINFSDFPEESYEYMPASELGADTRSLLKAAGFSETKIDDLQKNEVVFDISSDN